MKLLDVYEKIEVKNLHEFKKTDIIEDRNLNTYIVLSSSNHNLYTVKIPFLEEKIFSNLKEIENVFRTSTDNNLLEFKDTSFDFKIIENFKTHDLIQTRTDRIWIVHKVNKDSLTVVKYPVFSSKNIFVELDLKQMMLIKKVCEVQ